MLCDDCGRNEAVVQITLLGPEGRVEKHLCQHCAANYGGYLFPTQRKDMSVNDFLKGVFNYAPEEEQKDDQTAEKERPQAPREDELVCPNCGMSYHDFLQTGKIGCSVCYATFRRQLEPILRRIHGSSTHSGKIPHRTGGTLETKHQINLLRARQQEAVEQENYELAAECRDRIRALEQQLALQEGGVQHGAE